MSPSEAAQEALSPWTRQDALARVDSRWTPQLMTRFAGVVRGVLDRDPDAARRAGLVRTARAILRGSEETQCALGRDTALGRWTTAVERALARGESLTPWMALVPRLGVAAAILSGGDLDTTVILGSGGRARIPADGRVLQGAPGRPVRVSVKSGALMTHAQAARRAGPFEVADGDAEGGAMPTVQPLSGGSLTEIVRPLEAGATYLMNTSPGLADEIATLAPVLVGVSAAEDVSHSASLATARGVIWLTPVSRPLVVAETLVHEASHLKFFFVEDLSPFVLPQDPPRFEVPWRPDRRPLRAVLMGLHAWVRVLDWLEDQEGSELAQAAAERTVILRKATDAAADIVDGVDGLTDAGTALVAALCNRVRER